MKNHKFTFFGVFLLLTSLAGGALAEGPSDGIVFTSPRLTLDGFSNSSTFNPPYNSGVGFKSTSGINLGLQPSSSLSLYPEDEYLSEPDINASLEIPNYRSLVRKQQAESNLFSLDTFSLNFTSPLYPYSGYGTNIKKRSPMNFGLGLDTMTSFQFEAPTEESTQVSRMIKDVKIGTTNDYSCTFDEDPLGDLAEAMDWTKCYKNRVSFTTSDVNSDRELLKQDFDICKCLRDSVLEPISSVMNSSILANKNYRGVASEVEKKLNQNQEIINQDHDRTLNGLMFHSAFATRSIDYTKAYSSSLFKSDERADAFKVREEDGRIIGHELNFRNTDLSGELVVDSKKPYEPGQCISPRQYMMNRQFPSAEDKDSKYVLNDLKKDFEPKDWDFRLLEKDYRSMMSLPLAERRLDYNREKIKALKAKLKFLNRSPLIKYLMAASIEEFDSKKLELPKEIAGTLDNSSSESLLDSKQRLFGIMKRLGDEGCNSIKAHESDCQSKYREDLGNFFKERKHVGLVTLSSHKDILEKTNTRLEKTDFLTGRSPATHATNISQRNLVQEFMEKYKLPSPDNCEPNITSETAVKCVNIYAGYCKVLDTRMPEINRLDSDEDLEIADNLDELLANDFNPDYKSNPDFQAYNNEVCNKKPPGFWGIGSKSSINEFKAEYCKRKENTGKEYCREPMNGESWNHIWANYFEEVNPKDNTIMSANPNRHGNGFSHDEMVSITQNTSTDIFSFLGSSESDGRSFSSEGLAENLEQTIPTVSSEESDYSAVSSMPATVKQDNPNALPYFNYASNYSNAEMNSQQSETKSEAPMIEEMSQSKREEMLADWEKEYQEWKESKGDRLSPADSAANEQMKAEIATLKALLAQQQQMSKQQLELLNDAIASRAKENAKAQEPSPDKAAKTSPRNISSVYANNTKPTDEEISRGPASVNETAFNSPNSSSGSGKGASLGGSGNGTGAGASVSSSNSSDSVAREEAKLINLRRFSDGSITIESTQRSSNQAGNAISVPVSEEQYRILQTNPAGLNLGQIEKRIPPEHIAKLEKNGEIILLLRNGEKPPFEVKVQKKDNKLVYSVKDRNGREQAPVSRVYTRQALQDLTKGLR